MALTSDAGKKKPVGLARNLFADSSTAAIVESKDPENKTVAELNSSVSIETQKPSAQGAGAQSGQPYRTSQAHAQSGRTRKLSFLSTRELEERFKKARLKGGFFTIEDAHNEAMRLFCEGVEKGNISNF